MSRSKNIIIIVLLVALFSVLNVTAGDPTGPSTEPASTFSYTLEDIYNRLSHGTVGSRATFSEPSSGPGTGTGHTLDELMAKAPAADNTNGATTADATSGKTFWGLNTASAQWGWRTGTGSTSTDSAPVPKSGQTTCYDASGNTGNIISCSGTGQDGEHQAGVAWPTPRFTDNNNGTVTDNLTGLIWLKNANCFGRENWTTALSSANRLANGTCGLTDGSTAGEWRLPNVKELRSLIDWSQYNPALPEGHPFSGVQSSFYWSSTSYAGNPAVAWSVYLFNGGAYAYDKTSRYYVWPVRAGQ